MAGEDGTAIGPAAGTADRPATAAVRGPDIQRAADRRGQGGAGCPVRSAGGPASGTSRSA